MESTWLERACVYSILHGGDALINIPCLNPNVTVTPMVETLLVDQLDLQVTCTVEILIQLPIHSDQ